MTNKADGINIDIRVNISEKWDEVNSFIFYLGTVFTDQSSKPEVLSRIAKTTAVLAKQKYLSKPKYQTHAPHWLAAHANTTLR